MSEIKASTLDDLTKDIKQEFEEKGWEWMFQEYMRVIGESHDLHYQKLKSAYQELETAVRDLYYSDGDLNKVWVDALTAVSWLKQRMEQQETS